MATIVAALGSVLAGCVSFTLAAYIGAARARRPAACAFEADEPLPWWLRAAAAAREAAVTLLVVLPLPIARQDPPREPRVPARFPVVLLHGYALPASSCRWLARRLRRDGWAVHVSRYRGLLGNVEHSADAVGETIAQVRRDSGAPAVDVVAHGLGGLVARAHLRRRGAAAGVRRLVTLGTPHAGTEAFAWFGLDPMVRQMRPGSALLASLATDDPVPAIADVVSLHSIDDALVVPPENGYYPGAFNIELRAVGHFSLLASTRVYALVRENLAAGAEAAP